MISRALFTSRTQHYCTPPEITVPMLRLLAPPGSRRRLLDPATNGAASTGAGLTADGERADGKKIKWSDGDAWYNNNPYNEMLEWAALQAYWGGKVGVPGVSLVPARTDTKWFQEHIAPVVTAILLIKGRLCFHLPIPLAAEDAAPPKKDEDPYFLRRHFPWATDDNLPDGFRLLEPGVAVGPELGKNGKPQAAPFPSMVCFFGDDLGGELAASTGDPIPGPGAELTFDPETGVHFLNEAEGPYAPDVSDDFARAWIRQFGHRDIKPENPHPIDVREFARHFGPLGTLVVFRGPYRGVYT